MGTEVLRPQDCLVERFLVYQGSYGVGYTKANNHINNYAYKKPSMVKTDHKKRYNNQNQQYQQQNNSTKVHSRALSTHTNNRNDFEMGQVSSSRRGGSSLDSLNCGIKKESRNKRDFDHANIYAGSACSVSPSPSSLPLPTFFKKQEELNAFDDSATRDLRRLLRLQ